MSLLWNWRFRRLRRTLQKLKRADPEIRRRLERKGVHLLPASYYSAIPTVDDLESSFEANGDGLPYLGPTLFPGARLRAFLATLGPYAREFDAPPSGDEDTATEFFWANRWFSGVDALAYYAMIRRLAPRRIVEVGCGFSTLVAQRALDRNGAGEIHCIEPHPRAFLRTLPRVRELVEQQVQRVPVSFFTERLGEGDFLFIDSTHTVKAGSDCLYLYLKVIPALDVPVCIHVHDVYLPAGFPRRLQLEEHKYWTEQYLLLALLTDNPGVEVLFGTHYHRRVNPDALTEFVAGKTVTGGASFWFRRKP